MHFKSITVPTGSFKDFLSIILTSQSCSSLKLAFLWVSFCPSWALKTFQSDPPLYFSQSHFKPLTHSILLKLVKPGSNLICSVSWLTSRFFNWTSFLAALAEILSVKEVSSRKLYYVHYIDCEYCLRFLWTVDFWRWITLLEIMVVFTYHFLCEKSTSAWMSGSQGTDWTWRSFSSLRKKLKHQPRMVFQAPVLVLQKEKWYVCPAPPNVYLSSRLIVATSLGSVI